MSALALVADRFGARVSGSDRSDSPYLQRLRSAGIEARIGHSADQVPADAEVVVSSAISEENPELAVARARGLAVIHRGELLAEVCETSRVIAVAGTHGKTTTAGMIVWALRRLGAACGGAIGSVGYLIGGDLPADGEFPAGNAAAPVAGIAAGPLDLGDWLVVETDESDGSFLRVTPEIAIVTNVELDHHSHWASQAALFAAFNDFLAPVRVAIVEADRRLDRIVPNQANQVIRYSLETAPRPALRAPGLHNADNALAALAAIEAAFGAALGSRDALAAALADFPGMRRRIEFRGTIADREVSVYDDYAHHPSEVRAGLSALRELSPRRLVVVFQPHLYSRTKALGERFGVALAAADLVGVLDVYAAREQPVGDLAAVSGLDVARAAAAAATGRRVLWLRSIERARQQLAVELRPGDLVVTMGAGDIDSLASALLRGEGASR